MVAQGRDDGRNQSSCNLYADDLPIYLDSPELSQLKSMSDKCNIYLGIFTVVQGKAVVAHLLPQVPFPDTRTPVSFLEGGIWLLYLITKPCLVLPNSSSSSSKNAVAFKPMQVMCSFRASHDLIYWITLRAAIWLYLQPNPAAMLLLSQHHVSSALSTSTY